MKHILVAGGGLIGTRHIEAVQANRDCALVGLVDPDMSLRIDVPRFASMEDVTAHVDGVIIATPTHLHVQHGQHAAAQGWHMLIEKPVADTPEDAARLDASLRGSKSASLVGHHRRYHASVQQLKSMIEDGAIGQVVTASMIWAMRKPDSYFDGNWRTTGGSPVMINLVHDIDLLRFCLGEITKTTALRGAGIRGDDRVESGGVLLAFACGATGTISFADNAPSPWGFEAGTGENPNIGTTAQDMLWITGTKGAISFPSMTLWSGTDWGTAATRKSVAVAQNAQTPLDAQLSHFIDVMDGAAPMIDVADATRTLALATEIETQLYGQKPAGQTTQTRA